MAFMLSDKDIDKLLEVFAAKNEVREIVREEVREELKEFTGLMDINRKTLGAVEGLASSIEGQKLENAARDAQLSRHDGWIHQIAKETPIKLTD